MKKLFVLFIALIFAASLSYAQTKDKKEVIKTEKTTFAVKRMTCSGCVANVENKLKKINGVKDCKVSLNKKSAIVNYDPKKISEKEIAETMNKTHYKFSKKTSKKEKVNTSKPKKIKK